MTLIHCFFAALLFVTMFLVYYYLWRDYRSELNLYAAIFETKNIPRQYKFKLVSHYLFCLAFFTTIFVLTILVYYFLFSY
jgi:uncharacterized membrane protein